MVRHDYCAMDSLISSNPRLKNAFNLFVSSSAANATISESWHQKAYKKMISGRELLAS